MFKIIKKLSRFVGEYKKSTLLSPLFVSFEVIMECIIPFIASDLILIVQKNYENVKLKFLLLENDTASAAVFGGILVVLAMMSLAFGALAGRHCSVASCGFAKNLRHRLYVSSQEFSFENIDKFSTSSMITRMTTDVNNVQNAFMMLIRTAIRSPFMFIFSIIMAFALGGKMALIFVVVVPILLFGLFSIIKIAMPIFKRVFKKYDKLNNSIQENVKGMRVVKSFVREEYEKEKFGAASDNVRADFERADKILAFNSPIMQLCMYSVMLFVCFFGSRLIISSNSASFDVGKFSALLTYGMQILSSLMMLSFIFVMMTMAGESANRICEVIDEEPTIVNPKNPVYVVKNGEIEFKNVSFKYAKRAEKNALDSVNIKINSGMTVGIIGGTGSSKSTFIQLIPRLYDVTDGAVTVGGVDVRDYDLDALRNEVSVVLQKNVLFSGTIKENLRWGDEHASDEEIKRVCKLACADEFIESFPDGYDTYIEQGGTNVSGGQKQRLCIARALLKKPKILILDDSTSAVDTKTDALIRKAMREEIPNTTKIIIAQRISSVEDADMIIVIDDGKINGVGTHAQLLETNAIYNEVYTSQMKGAKME